MSAVANGCGLSPPSDGLEFPPCGIHDLPTVLRPKYDGGHLEKNGTVEVVSSLEIDGRQVQNDIRFGVFVVIEGNLSAEQFTLLQNANCRQRLATISASALHSTV